MRKLLIILMVILFAMSVLAVPAFAFGFGDVKAWITMEVISLAISAVLVIVTGIFGVFSSKVNKTFKEFGEFMVALSNATEDNKIDKDEIKILMREGKDIFNVWRK